MYNKEYNTKEINQIIFMRNQGKPWKEISKATGRSVNALSFKWNQLKNKGHVEDLNVGGKKVGVTLAYSIEETPKPAVEAKPEPKPEVKQEPQQFVQTATMTPREMIKKLYDMGYRIEENKLVCYVKQTVNVKDIING